MSMRPTILLLALSGAGCATYPDNASYLYGERYYRANSHTFSTRITAIDGRSTMLTSKSVPIEPGEHVVTLVTAPVAGLTRPEYRELRLAVEPCRRYYIVAERDNRLLQDWRPVIDHVEHAGSAGCP